MPWPPKELVLHIKSSEMDIADIQQAIKEHGSLEITLPNGTTTEVDVIDNQLVRDASGTGYL